MKKNNLPYDRWPTRNPTIYNFRSLTYRNPTITLLPSLIHQNPTIYCYDRRPSECNDLIFTIVGRSGSKDPFFYHRWASSIQRSLWHDRWPSNGPVLRSLADHNPTITCSQVVGRSGYNRFLPFFAIVGRSESNDPFCAIIDWAMSIQR